MGLDKPFIYSTLSGLGSFVSGNMGYSVKSYEAVSAMIGSHLGPTLLLMGVSLIVKSYHVGACRGFTAPSTSIPRGITLWSQPPFSEAAYRDFSCPCC